jgi:hypothetical protein
MGKHNICITTFFIPLSVNFTQFYVLIPIQFMSQEGRVSVATRLRVRRLGNHGSYLKMEIQNAHIASYTMDIRGSLSRHTAAKA